MDHNDRDEPIAGLVPELKVTDFERSRSFYVGLLGFHVLYERPEQAFAYLYLGRAELMIEHDDGIWRTGLLEYPYGRGINLQIEVPDAEALQQRLQTQGYPVLVPIEVRWYRRNDVYVGQKQFLVQDPDGYLLRFGEDLGTQTRPG